MVMTSARKIKMDATFRVNGYLCIYVVGDVFLSLVEVMNVDWDYLLFMV